MLITNLSIIVRCSHIYSNRALEAYDLGHSEQAALMFLSAHKDMNQEALSRHFNLDKGTITKTMAKLEKKEYIIRSINPVNQREKRISLTEKGHEIISYMENIQAEWNRCILDGFSSEEAEEVNRIAAKMAGNAIKKLQGEYEDNNGTR